MKPQSLCETEERPGRVTGRGSYNYLNHNTFENEWGHYKELLGNKHKPGLSQASGSYGWGHPNWKNLSST